MKEMTQNELLDLLVDDRYASLGDHDDALSWLDRNIDPDQLADEGSPYAGAVDDPLGLVCSLIGDQSSDLAVLFEARYIEPMNVVKHENTVEYISIGA